MVGAGGLGSPVALYLGSAGVGHITLVDDDVVDLTNLQRQIAHSVARVGQPKVESAAQAIAAINPDVRVTCIQLGPTPPGYTVWWPTPMWCWTVATTLPPASCQCRLHGPWQATRLGGGRAL